MAIDFFKVKKVSRPKSSRNNLDWLIEWAAYSAGAELLFGWGCWSGWEGTFVHGPTKDGRVWKIEDGPDGVELVLISLEEVRKLTSAPRHYKEKA